MGRVQGTPGVGKRATLARLAREAALDSYEVVALHSGRPGARTVDDRGELVGGVACVAAAGGRYELTLYLTVRPVDLPQLAERARQRVNAVAAKHGLGDAVGAVNVVVVDVVTESPASG